MKRKPPDIRQKETSLLNQLGGRVSNEASVQPQSSEAKREEL